MYYSLKSYFIIYVALPPTVVMRGHPTNSNFFTGLQLTLTCTITLPQLESISTVSTQWSQSGSPLTSSNRVTVGEWPVEVGPGHYHTSVVFNSLDSTRDEGEYTCAVRVTYSSEGFPDVITESTASLSITVPSKSVDTTISCYLLVHHCSWSL